MAAGAQVAAHSKKGRSGVICKQADHGRQARTAVSWTTHQRAVAFPFHDGTEEFFLFFFWTTGTEEVQVHESRSGTRIRRGRVYGDACFCLLRHRSEASRQGNHAVGGPVATLVRSPLVQRRHATLNVDSTVVSEFRVQQGMLHRPCGEDSVQW